MVPNDREWFTKTIVADGPHMAVWVNGYQVSDWTDTRPEKENAREGLRLKRFQSRSRERLPHFKHISVDYALILVMPA